MFKAAVLRKPKSPLEIEEIELDPPKAGEVLVKVGASGVCHSDLSVIEGRMPAMPPIILGHEAAGVVEEVGEGVTNVKAGDHVIMSFMPSCGSCHYCATARPYLCDAKGAQLVTMGAMWDGTKRFKDKNGKSVNHFLGCSSFAEKTIIMAQSAIKIPKEVPLDRACLVGCAVMTGVGAALNTARVTGGSTVAIIGCGGVGLNAIQGCALAGARQIIGVDIHPDKFQMAKDFGATHVVDASEGDPVKAIKKLTGGRGVDYAFEALGQTKTIMQAYNSVGKGGRAIIIGLTSFQDQLTIPAFSFFQGKSIEGCVYGSCRPSVDMPNYIEMYQNGRLKLDELVSQTYKLEEINDAFEAMKGGGTARGVIVYN